MDQFATLNSSKMKVVLALNELNFNLVKLYTSKGFLPNFTNIIKKYDLVETVSEKKYHLLEPWIQWMTVYSGLDYEKHKIFRLGDIKNINFDLIFEKIDEKGLKQLLISPFNCPNTLKSSSSIFVTDPWTNAKSTANKRHLKLAKILIKAINNNAGGGRLSLYDKLILAYNILLDFKLSDYFFLIKIFKSKSFKPALLDLIIYRIFTQNSKIKDIDFGWLFLNGAAHIQHHYYFNSSVVKSELENPQWYIKKNDDCILYIYQLYDKIIGDILNNGYEFIIATGLSQKLHKNQTFYYRLSNHKSFLKELEIEFNTVHPRMSRDFLIEFNSAKNCKSAEKKLNSILLNNKKLFKVDNRNDSLFVELIYDKEIKIDSKISFDNRKFTIFNYVDFVAIKNGEHSTIGYYISNFQSNSKKRIKLNTLRSKIESWVFKESFSNK